LAKHEFTCDLIKEHYGVDVDLKSLPPLRDPYDVDGKVMDAFVRGLTLGAFQFSGRGVNQLIRHVKPDNAIDLAAINALYRPGPIKFAFEYGDRKNGMIPVTYWHESVEPYLKETKGLMVFQEQLLQVAMALGNFTGAEADNLRKITSKLYRLPGDKARQIMQEWHERWMQGCRDNGLTDKDANTIWEAMLGFSSYSFNKPHAGSYSLAAYQDMWLKVFYPQAFYAAILSKDKKAKPAEDKQFKMAVMREASVFDVEFLPPDINKSKAGFSIEGNKVRFGIAGLNKLSDNAYEEIEKNRPYKSYRHFVKKTPSGFGVGRNVSLIAAGAFDSIDDRTKLLSKVQKFEAQKFAVEMQCGCKKTVTGEDKLAEVYCKKHDQLGVKSVEEKDNYYTLAEHIKEKYYLKPTSEPIALTDQEIKVLEEQALRIPLSHFKEASQYSSYISERIYTEEEIEHMEEGESVVIGGEITNKKVIVTKTKKEEMAFLYIEFEANNYSATVFPRQYAQFKHELDNGAIVLVSGKLNKRKQVLANVIASVKEMVEEEDSS
jgi:DNA polymerase-3 subunit alpha